jgi:hypothetical protein
MNFYLFFVVGNCMGQCHIDNHTVAVIGATCFFFFCSGCRKQKKKTHQQHLSLRVCVCVCVEKSHHCRPAGVEKKKRKHLGGICTHARTYTHLHVHAGGKKKRTTETRKVQHRRRENEEKGMSEDPRAPSVQSRSGALPFQLTSADDQAGTDVIAVFTNELAFRTPLPAPRVMLRTVTVNG